METIPWVRSGDGGKGMVGKARVSVRGRRRRVVSKAIVMSCGMRITFLTEKNLVGVHLLQLF